MLVEDVVKLRFPRDRGETAGSETTTGSEITGQLNITFMAKNKITVMAQLTVIFMDLFHDIFHQTSCRSYSPVTVTRLVPLGNCAICLTAHIFSQNPV